MQLYKNLRTSGLFKNTFFLGIDKGFQFISQLVTVLILAKYLKADAFGSLSYAITIISILTVLANWGMERTVVLELTKVKKENKRIVVTKAFEIRTIISFFLICSLFLIKNVLFSFVNKDIGLAIMILSFSILFNSWIIFDAVNQFDSTINKTVKARVFGIVTIIVLRILLVYFKASYGTIASTYVVEQLLYFIFMAVQSKHLRFKFNDINIIQQNPQKKIILLSLLKNGAYVVGTGLSTLLYMRITQLIVQQKFPSSQLGMYSLIISILEIPLTLGSVLSILLVPKLALLKRNDEGRFENIIPFVMLLFVLLGLLATSGLYVLSFPLGTFYSSYTNFKLYFQIAILVMPLTFIGYFFVTCFLSEDQLKMYFLITLIATITQPFLSLLVIHFFGFIGSFYAYIFSQLFSSVILPFFFKKGAIKRVKAMFNCISITIFKIKFRELSIIYNG
jgi:O-antigen/teichoic acid export membrane protein